MRTLVSDFGKSQPNWQALEEKYQRNLADGGWNE
jgi:hypothetical protein